MAKPSLFERVETIKMPVRIAILAGTLLVLAGLFAYLLYLPKNNEIASLENDVANLERQLMLAKKRAENLEKFEAQEVRVNVEFNEALRLLPNEREIPSLLRSITQMGSDSNLQFNLFSPRKEVPKDFYIEIPVAIEVGGSFHEVAMFFDKVGRMERIVNILDVSMKPVGELSTKLATVCTAVTYRFKGKEDEDNEEASGEKK